MSCTSDGNSNESDTITEYKFCDLEKDIDTLTITGRLVKIFDGETQTYNRIKDTIDLKYEEDKAESATFCFDVLKEEIAFITRRGLGYLQFGKYFVNLLEMKFPQNSFELILEKNVGNLKSRVFEINRILKMSAIIVPPNANEDEFEKLLGASVPEFRETEATKYTQIIEVSAKSKKSINAQSKFFERVFYASGKGYATMSVEGRDSNNQKVIVDSDKDTPYIYPIPNREKDSIIAFKELAEKGFEKLLYEKSKMEIRGEEEVNGKPKS